MSELLDLLNTEVDRLSKGEDLSASLDVNEAFINQLEQLYKQIESSSNDDTSVYNSVVNAQKAWEDKLRKNMKTSNFNHLKFNRTLLEKIDDFELNDAYLYKIDKDQHNLKLVDNAVKLHLIRNGDLNVLENDMKSDASITNDERVDLELLRKFTEMNEILKEIQNHNLKKAIEWSIENEGTLLSKGSTLEFKLHKLQYLQYYQSNEIGKAYSYALQWFPKFINHNDNNLFKVSKLITSILFDAQDKTSPYYSNNQLSSTIYNEISILFSKEFCSVLGFAYESSIYTIVLAGIISFPSFIKFSKLKNTNGKIDWTSKDELPFEVNLPDNLKQYHPIFICPVSKEETTSENPPIALPCHHVIAKHSMQRMSKNGSNFKCPYCPTTCLPSQCKQITFYHI